MNLKSYGKCNTLTFICRQRACVNIFMYLCLSNIEEIMEQNKVHSFKEWLFATRPWSFTASALPVIAGTAALWHMGMAPNLWIALWLTLNVVVIHASGNVWSDCKDYLRGVDTTEAIGVTNLTSGLFQEKELRYFSIILLAIAAVSGIVMVSIVDLRLLWLGVAGCLLSIIYPWMKYNALGDLNILLCYGVLPALAAGVAASGIWAPILLLYVMPVALITLSILHANNTRDIASDRKAGIHTMCMTLGSGWSTIIYILEVTMPYIWVLWLDWRAALPILLTLPLLIRNIRLAVAAWKQKDNTPIHTLDQLSAQLQLTFAVLLSIGLVVSKLIG